MKIPIREEAKENWKVEWHKAEKCV
jgi:hypothetical protein